jgi:ubiquinone/menaquinone biosynthesis C-methylase UbiE
MWDSTRGAFHPRGEKIQCLSNPWWKQMARMSPFPSNYFASGFSNSALEHIPHIDEVLKETARVLKPGAPFYFCVPNTRYFSPRYLFQRRLASRMKTGSAKFRACPSCR